MRTRGKLLVAVGIAGVACLGALGFSLYFADDKIDAKGPVSISPQPGSGSRESSSSPLATDSTKQMSILSESNVPKHAKLGDFSNRNVLQLDSLGESSPRTVNSRTADGASSESALPENPDVAWPHLPLAFINPEGVLPATNEVAAALQNLQQDFIKATGADVVTNPSDPAFQQRWEWALSAADEQYYALFGIEAMNALSIMEAYQRGHF